MLPLLHYGGNRPGDGEFPGGDVLRHIPEYSLSAGALIPFLVLCMYGQHLDFEKKHWKPALLRAGVAVVSFFAGLLLLLCLKRALFAIRPLPYAGPGGYDNE